MQVAERLGWAAQSKEAEPPTHLESKDYVIHSKWGNSVKTAIHIFLVGTK